MELFLSVAVVSLSTLAGLSLWLKAQAQARKEAVDIAKGVPELIEARLRELHGRVLQLETKGAFHKVG